MINAAPSIYDLYVIDGVKFFDEVDDAVAVCAKVFGGGIKEWLDLTMFELNEWADRALQLSRSEDE